MGKGRWVPLSILPGGGKSGAAKSSPKWYFGPKGTLVSLLREMAPLIRLCFLLCCAVGLCFAVEILVPGVANQTSEGGAHFATELRVRNDDGSGGRLRLRWIPEGEASAPEPIEIDIVAGQTLRYRNLLQEVWGLDETAGVLVVEADRMISVSARRYADAMEASAGMELIAIPKGDLLGAGRFGEFAWLAQSEQAQGAVWVIRDARDSKVALVLFDAEGKEIGRKDFGEGAAVQRVRLSDLVAAPAAVVRGQLQVLSGNATAFGELFFPANQDWMGTGLTRLELESTQQVLSPAMRTTGPDGVLLRSDLRVANPWGAPVDLQLSFRGVVKRFVLAGGETKEWSDVLGGLFEVNEDAQGTVLLSASKALAAMGRLSVYANPEAPPMVSAHPVEAWEAMTGPGENWRNLGVSENLSALWLSTRSREAVAEARLQRFDADGNLTQETGTPVSLEVNQSRLDSMVDLLGESTGVGNFVYQPVAGFSAAKLVALRAGSYDPAVVGFAPSELATCASPAIVRFWGSAKSFPAAGKLRLEWEVEGAERVDVAPGLENLPAKGSVEVSVAAATEFVMRATNACGREDARWAVALGTPVLRSAVRGSGTGGLSEGSPGQLMILQFENLTEVDRIDFLVMRAADGAEKPVSIRKAADGTVKAFVPYWFVEGGTRPYRTGAMQVSAQLSDGTRTGALPYTISPLVYSGDAIAGLRAFVDARAAMVRAAIGAVRSGGDSALATVMESSSAKYESEFRTLVNELAAGRDGVLQYATAVAANSIRVTITRQDVADLLAYQANVNAANEALDPAEAAQAKAAAQTPWQAGSCLGQQPVGVQIQYCKQLERAQKSETGFTDTIGDLFEALGVPAAAVDKGESWLKGQLAKWKMLAKLKKIQGWMTVPNIKCLVDPIRLEKFITDKTFIKYTRYEKQATPIKVKAFMRAEKTKDQVKQMFRDAEANAIRKHEKAKKLSKDQVEALIRMFEELTNFDMEAELAKVLNQIKVLQPTATYQVGDCDLALVYPKRNGPGSATDRNAGYVHGKSLLRFATYVPQGEDDYYLMGVRPGKETLCIQPRYNNFLFHSVLEQHVGRMTTLCQYQIGVSTRAKALVVNSQEAAPIFGNGLDVGEGQPSAYLVADNVEAGGDVTFSQGMVEGEPDVSEGFRRSQSDGYGSAKATFLRSGAYSWSLEMEATAYREQIAPGQYSPHYGFATITVMFRNPENRTNTQAVRITGTLSGGPQCLKSMGLYADSKSASGQSGSASVELSGATRGQISAMLSAGLASAGETVTCKFSGTLTLVR